MAFLGVAVGVAGGVLESLSNVIITAKMKVDCTVTYIFMIKFLPLKVLSGMSVSLLQSVCNLGMWCISMQQFDGSLLNAHFQSLLKAIVHALDNPFGSLSTTFEAIQVKSLVAIYLHRGCSMMDCIKSIVMLLYSTGML